MNVSPPTTPGARSPAPPASTAGSPRNTPSGSGSGSSFADVLACQGATNDEMTAGAPLDADLAGAPFRGAESLNTPELERLTTTATHVPASTPMLRAPMAGPWPGNAASRPEATQSRARGADAQDPCDPLLRQPGLCSPPASIPMAPPNVQAAVSSAAAVATIEQLLPTLVSRVAWSGDAKKGAVRLEFRAGALAGGLLLVEAQGGDLHVTVSAPAETDVEDLRQRLAARLAARGLRAEVEIE